MRPFLILKVATVALFFMIMLQGQFPKISVPNTWINQKVIASDHINASPLLRRHLVRGYVPPSGPNPGTKTPALAAKGHDTAPSPQGSLQKNPRSPSRPNGDTSIP